MIIKNESLYYTKEEYDLILHKKATTTIVTDYLDWAAQFLADGGVQVSFNSFPSNFKHGYKGYGWYGAIRGAADVSGWDLYHSSFLSPKTINKIKHYQIAIYEIDSDSGNGGLHFSQGSNSCLLINQFPLIEAQYKVDIEIAHIQTKLDNDIARTLNNYNGTTAASYITAATNSTVLNPAKTLKNTLEKIVQRLSTVIENEKSNLQTIANKAHKLDLPSVTSNFLNLDKYISLQSKMNGGHIKPTIDFTKIEQEVQQLMQKYPEYFI